jgi:membrane dipeptidase
MFIVDGHCDTLLELYKNRQSFWEQNDKGHTDFVRLKKSMVKLQFMAVYIEPEYKPYGALSRALEILDFYKSNLEKESLGKIKTVKSKKDIQELMINKSSGDETIGILLSIEGGEALEGKLSTLRIIYELGFRSLTLTWNQRNQIGDGAWENETRGGLTSFGKEVIREMNSLGMVIDVSHLSETGFWDTVAISKSPVIASHSCCSYINKHPRNLSDDQLQALGKINGLVGINFYPNFLGEKEASIDNVVAHIEHAVEKAGIDSVGIGSDFDGIEITPKGLEDVTKMPFISEKLLARGWKEEEVSKIMGGNFIRVLERILS